MFSSMTIPLAAVMGGVIAAVVATSTTADVAAVTAVITAISTATVTLQRQIRTTGTKVFSSATTIPLAVGTEAGTAAVVRLDIVSIASTYRNTGILIRLRTRSITTPRMRGTMVSSSITPPAVFMEVTVTATTVAVTAVTGEVVAVSTAFIAADAGVNHPTGEGHRVVPLHHHAPYCGHGWRRLQRRL